VDITFFKQHKKDLSEIEIENKYKSLQEVLESMERP